MPLLSLTLALLIASSVAPGVSASTLIAFARYESGLQTTTLHDNTTGLTFRPPTPVAATSLATSLLSQGHSLDLGLMQVNSANLPRVGMSIAEAFEPSNSIRAGAQILTEAYQRCRRAGQVEEQAALRCAASVYNTGNESHGIANGYQAKVWRVAAQLVPAIRTDVTAPDPSDDGIAPQPRPRPPVVLEDALHPAPPVASDDDVMRDAIHLRNRKETP